MKLTDTFYRLHTKASLSEDFMARIERVRKLSRAAKTHAQKKQLAERLAAGRRLNGPEAGPADAVGSRSRSA